MVVTENAYPPLQFVDPKSGDAIGWEYDAMNEIAQRLNAKVSYQNASWDAMIPAVSSGQYDIGMTGIKADYIVVDPLRVDRDTFARIWEAWRDGYTDSMVEHTGVSREEIEQRWREMIECVRDPRGYALWQVPVWTAMKGEA